MLDGYSMAALAPLVFHFARFTFRRLSTPVDCSRRRHQPELWEFYLPCAPVARKKVKLKDITQSFKMHVSTCAVAANIWRQISEILVSPDEKAKGGLGGGP